MVVQIFYTAPRGLHGEGRHVAVQNSQVTFMNLVAFMGSALWVSFTGSWGQYYSRGELGAPFPCSSAEWKKWAIL